MSGGQQQWIALARALINRPRVLLLDEPLPALDPFLCNRAREALKRLQRELGITFIHVTHGQDKAMALADLMVVMANGHIRQAAHPREMGCVSAARNQGRAAGPGAPSRAGSGVRLARPGRTARGLAARFVGSDGRAFVDADAPASASALSG